MKIDTVSYTGHKVIIELTEDEVTHILDVLVCLGDNFYCEYDISGDSYRVLESFISMLINTQPHKED